MRSTVLDDLLTQSIRLNNLFIPIKAVETTLARNTLSLVATNDDEDYPISLVGSCVAIRYQERYLVLCTRHQLKDWNLQRIALITEDGQRAITSGGVRHFTELNESDFHDLAAFDFTEPCRELPFLRQRFFDFREAPPDTLNINVIFLIASGYPFADQDYDLANERKLGRAKRLVLCRLDQQRQSQDEALMRIRAVDSIKANPDGMSGGAVFVVQMVKDEPTAYFAGIITRANSEYLHFVKTPFIQQFLNMWLDRFA